MNEVVEYVDNAGRNAFREWLRTLDRTTFARIAAVVARMKEGNFGDVQPIGSGLSETRLHFGPGYRIYFGREGRDIVILLGGGSKKRQAQDIADAHRRWEEYQVNRRRN